MPSVVPVMVVSTVLFTIGTVVVPAVIVPVGVDNAPWSGFHDHYTRWWRWCVIIPVTMPVAIVVAGVVRTVGTGGNRYSCDQCYYDRQQNSVLSHGSSSFCTV